MIILPKGYKEVDWIDFHVIRLRIKGLSENQMISLKLEKLANEDNRDVWGLTIPPKRSRKGGKNE